MDSKYRRFYLDWTNIRKSTIYKIVSVIVFMGVLIGGGYWAWNSDILTAVDEATQTPRDSARILTYQGDVRIIRVSTRKTERAAEGLTVQAGDTIQTQSDGRCQILMIDGSTLSIRPNSTVVIRDSSSIFGGKTVRVKLDDGQIRVRTEDQPENTSNIVEIKESENQILGQSEASFNLNQQSDRGEIRVTRGNIITDSDGVKTSIRENEYAAVEKGKLASRETLLSVPSPVEPPPNAQIPVQGSSRDETFSWKRSVGGKDITYQFQLALSPFFVADKMLQEKADLRDTRFGVSNMSPDIYFWRVRAASGSGQKSEWSEPARITLYRPKGASRIEAGNWNVERLGGGVYRISGKTKPGASVRASGRETFAKSDGSFTLQVSTSSSSVSVSISDDKGNRGQYNVSLRR